MNRPMVGGSSTNRAWLQEGLIRGSMLGKSILPTDEELGKKDDDHKPGHHGRAAPWAATSRSSRTPLRWRRRRILLAVVGLGLLYLLFTTAPPLGSLQFSPPRFAPMPEGIVEPLGAPVGLKVPRVGSTPPREYGGPAKFYRLAASLHAASHTQGYRMHNRNVLFAMSSLESVATLVPIICEMSKWSRNWVHAAFIGREDIPLGVLLEMNGVDKTACPAMWHDARPDYSEYSNDKRAESSVAAALVHIHTFLHPQVAIMDDSNSENAFFVRGMRSKTATLDIPLIEIPKNHWEHFMWMTRLDSGSLKSWHQPTVEILIQAPTDATGGILRLLKSLKEADYSGLRPPRLTIELPAEIDNSVKDYLENFVWPPGTNNSPLLSNQITIRRRITHQHSTQEESAIRFLELFYPTSTKNSHVLLLTPNAQLSPLYFHYLTYVMLEYRYSSYGEEDSANVMGASLELPSVFLDGKTELVPPTPADMHTSRYENLFSNVPTTQFLWQAPNSHALLFFGDKWAELHSFLSNRVTKHHLSPKVAARPKLISETLPAWTEYMLELMRARGYSLFYPATRASESLATVHNELYHVPEEFAPREKSDIGGGADAPPKLPDEPFLRAETPPSKPSLSESPIIPHSRPLHLTLPFEGDLPEIPHLPYLLYDGEKVLPTNVSIIAAAYADKFRETVGGCKIPKGKRRVIEKGSAKDLFCFGDEDEDDWEDVEAPVSAMSGDEAGEEERLGPTTSSTLVEAISTAKPKATVATAGAEPKEA
ncbi:hypothetical protein K491DRAFT_689502 [Lophiostoma macrostomum CBS 122681]|uniref:Glycosyltransferase 2 n=1 Tax=Lophiostoma macrostomum CBS 122681 TaxID=1314788 RepID=A0A6A6TI75_9PLEO|nr:hypothetical protein K491DRAFT_689502 [Lophiostoma macrostomum CBS 122681]